MAKLRLAGNQIYQVGPTPFGHLQVVYADDGSQHEIEVLPAKGGLDAFSGNWRYPRKDENNYQDHVSNTPEKNLPGAYALADLPLGNRSPGDVWDILTQVHGQFAEHGLDIPYRPFSNSNSYANTVLSVVGVDTSKILEDATPPALKLAEFVGRATRPVEGEVYKHLVGLFPGVNYNVLQDEDHAISLDITGTDRGDIVRTGIRDDSIKGESGNDKLFGGGGGDIIDGGAHKDLIDGGPGDDVLSGGPGKDTFVASGGSDVILDFEPGKDKFRFPEETTTVTGTYDEMGRATILTHPEGTINLYKTDLSAHRGEYLEITWASNPPVITGYDTVQEGDLIFLKLNYLDADGDAEGFGFRGVKGAGWAEETHPFSDPSYGRVSEGTIAYPFKHPAGFESDVEAWIYDKEGLRSDPVTVHLGGADQEEVAVPIETEEVPFFKLGGSTDLDPIGGTAV